MSRNAGVDVYIINAAPVVAAASNIFDRGAPPPGRLPRDGSTFGGDRRPALPQADTTGGAQGRG